MSHCTPEGEKIESQCGKESQYSLDIPTMAVDHSGKG
jgi:hypothetical protein